MVFGKEFPLKYFPPLSSLEFHRAKAEAERQTSFFEEDHRYALERERINTFGRITLPSRPSQDALEPMHPKPGERAIVNNPMTFFWGFSSSQPDLEAQGNQNSYDTYDSAFDPLAIQRRSSPVAYEAFLLREAQTAFDAHESTMKRAREASTNWFNDNKIHPGTEWHPGNPAEAENSRRETAGAEFSASAAAAAMQQQGIPEAEESDSSTQSSSLKGTPSLPSLRQNFSAMDLSSKSAADPDEWTDEEEASPQPRGYARSFYNRVKRLRTVRSPRLVNPRSSATPVQSPGPGQGNVPAPSSFTDSSRNGSA